MDPSSTTTFALCNETSLLARDVWVSSKRLSHFKGLNWSFYQPDCIILRNGASLNWGEQEVYTTKSSFQVSTLAFSPEFN